MKSFDLTPEQERLLAALATGELSRDDAAIAEARNAPEFRAAMQELEALQVALRAAGVEERADLAFAAAEAEPFAGADQLVRDAAPRPLRSPMRKRKPLALLLAAVLVAAVGLWWWKREEPLRRGDSLGGRVECLAPNGAVPEYGAFAWRWPLPERGYFLVTVFESERRQTVLATSPRLQANEWTPGVALPPAIYWEVRVYDVRGEEQEWGAARAERR
ncbi:MAG: hypothetical protein JNM84_06715 [Planctomycetes bacterium]|nr:hypothetical protein [Planctomycetota bacterium]